MCNHCGQILHNRTREALTPASIPHIDYAQQYSMFVPYISVMHLLITHTPQRRGVVAPLPPAPTDDLPRSGPQPKRIGLSGKTVQYNVIISIQCTTIRYYFSKTTHIEAASSYVPMDGFRTAGCVGLQAGFAEIGVVERAVVW